LQEATPFKDGNLTIFSFLNSGKLFKCIGGFYSHKQIQIIEDININWLWFYNHLFNNTVQNIHLPNGIYFKNIT
jgi:hypothetical protein